MSGFTTIKNHTKTTINNFTPADTTTIVEGNPSSTTNSITNTILNSHISTISRTILNIRSLTERRISTRDIMMITRNYNRSSKFTTSNSIIESTSNCSTSITISIKNTSLTTNYKLISSSLFNPLKIISQLSTNRSRRLRSKVLTEDLSSNLISLL